MFAGVILNFLQLSIVGCHSVLLLPEAPVQFSFAATSNLLFCSYDLLLSAKYVWINNSRIFGTFQVTGLIVHFWKYMFVPSWKRPEVIFVPGREGTKCSRSAQITSAFSQLQIVCYLGVPFFHVQVAASKMSHVIVLSQKPRTNEN